MKLSPRYKSYDLGNQTAGTVIEVILSCVNNVHLMDHANFQCYTEAENFKSIGGRMEKSPARFTIPTSGKWHVVVDKDGFHNLANSNVRAIPSKDLKAANTPAAQKPAISTSVKRETPGDRSARPDSEAYMVNQILKELNTYKQIANTDALTGLSNRRAFDNKMMQVFGNPQILSTIALILVDIDHFKKFNDTFGHAIGDSVLKIVAETIRKSLPKAAFPARTGGEEFGIIAKVASRKEAYQIAELARRAIESAPFIDTASGTDCGRVTISLGLCMADEAEAVGDLYNKSDLALYASKKSGRNRSTFFEENMQDNPASEAPEQKPIVMNL